MEKTIITLFITFIVNIAFSQPVKSYVVKRTTAAVTIDGKLNESDWSGALATDPFRFVDSGAKAGVSTVVKVLWDDNYLYVAFIAQDSSIWADIADRDHALWTRDVAELFIDTRGDSINYAEIGIGPNGAYYDYILPKQPEFNHWKINTAWNLPEFNPKVAISGTLNDTVPDKGWVMELAIPFNHVTAPSTLHLPIAGEVWRVNFCRIDFNYRDTTSAHYYAWNPTGAIAFHRPSKFGKLIFDK